MNIEELKEQALIEIHAGWKGKDKLTLSKCESLVRLCNIFKSLDYYVQHNFCNYPYDLVDIEDLRELEFHIIEYSHNE